MKHKELELSMKHNDFMTRSNDAHLRLLSSTRVKKNRKATQSQVLRISQCLNTRGSDQRVVVRS